MRVSILAGARPNFMKIAPLVRAFRNHGSVVRIIHSGQHYDKKMSQTFFDELEIPAPDVNLAVGSGSHVFQIAEVMKRLETDFIEHPASAVIVVGDVNSTVSGAIAACKMGMPVAHVEAGLRSHDRTMPEEINRRITDAVCDWLITSEPSGDENLRREGAEECRIYCAGNVMIDTQKHFLETARQLGAPKKHGLSDHEYAVLTLHRPSNVDSASRFSAIIAAVEVLAEQIDVIFPIHPRTRGRLEEFDLMKRVKGAGVHIVEPLGYLELLNLIDSSRLVLTDSGGLQEETTALRVPCLTLRENTERPVTVTQGSNKLVGCRTEAIIESFTERLSGPLRIGDVPDNWDGRASERIVQYLTDKIVEESTEVL